MLHQLRLGWVCDIEDDQAVSGVRDDVVVLQSGDNGSKGDAVLSQSVRRRTRNVPDDEHAVRW
jgi:hypothetical protein